MLWLEARLFLFENFRRKNGELRNILRNYPIMVPGYEILYGLQNYYEIIDFFDYSSEDDSSLVGTYRSAHCKGIPILADL